MCMRVDLCARACARVRAYFLYMTVTAVATSMDEPSLLVEIEDGFVRGPSPDVEGDLKTLNELSWRSGGSAGGEASS